jgi:hypothetical protein
MLKHLVPGASYGHVCCAASAAGGLGQGDGQGAAAEQHQRQQVASGDDRYSRWGHAARTVSMFSVQLDDSSIVAVLSFVIEHELLYT